MYTDIYHMTRARSACVPPIVVDSVLACNAHMYIYMYAYMIIHVCHVYVYTYTYISDNLSAHIVSAVDNR